MLELSDAGFPDTRWSLIDAILGGDGQCRENAMQDLAKTYWPPVYALLRRRGLDREQAAELTQAFFSEVVVQRQLFDQADASRGALKSLIRVAVNRFVTDQHRRKNAGPSKSLLSIDQFSDEDDALRDDKHSDPDELFDRRWALAVLDEALRRCEKHFCIIGKSKHWEAFYDRIIKPSMTMQSAPSHHQVALELGLPSRDESMSFVRVVRKRVLAMIRQIISENTKDPADQQAEFDTIVRLLA